MPLAWQALSFPLILTLSISILENILTALVGINLGRTNVKWAWMISVIEFQLI